MGRDHGGYCDEAVPLLGHDSGVLDGLCEMRHEFDCVEDVLG